MGTRVRPDAELSDVLKRYYTDYTTLHKPTEAKQRIFEALQKCRTSALGGHVQQCERCGKTQISYNSCRNRHCPKCQVSNRERWIQARCDDLLPVGYFHVVFTIAHQLNAYCLEDPKYFYDALFECSRDTLMSFGYDTTHLGAQLGMIAVLHTWGQNLSLHPHVHLIVPAGGITEDNQWKRSRNGAKYLFPIQALARTFRGKFMERWLAWHRMKKRIIPLDLRRELYALNWVIYAKEPFGGPKDVIEYLGRYTHKVAISNHRLISVDDAGVKFHYTDYKDGNKRKQMHLSGTEFLRRYALHFLPAHFHRMRHYGFLSNRNKPKLKQLQLSMGVIRKKREKLSWQEFSRQHLNYDPELCKHCKTGRLVVIEVLMPRAPPARLSNLSSYRNQHF